MLHRFTDLGGPVAFLAFLISGCAIHAPVSETVIFHDPLTRPSHERTVGYGVVGTYSPASEKVVEEANNLFGEDARRVRRDYQLNSNRLSGGGYLGIYGREGGFAVSGTLGLPVAGLDATLQLWKRNYLTVAASVPGHMQAYLQHRTLNSPNWGAVVALEDRRDLYGFERPSECTMCIDVEHVDVQSIGARSFTVYRARGIGAAASV